LDVEVIGKSHVFIPSIKAPVRVVADDLSQVTIDKCTGLVITQGGFAKTQIQQLAGDMSAALSGRSQLGIKSGTIATTLITATDETYISIAAAMQSLKLSTKGDAKIQLGSIINTLIWVGTGNEQISINNLSGTAEITANYNSRLNVEKANLDTLLAATSSTGKIKILGSVKNAALSARGASEIVIDKITGKILRKNQSSKGIITILNP
jgi:hypothetical protein